MMHRLLRASTVAFGLLLGGLAADVQAEETVNVYSARHYPSDQILFDLFTKQTGIAVKVINGNAEELMQRQQQEGESSPADVLITVDAGNLWRAQEMGLFQAVKSDILEKEIPANLRDPEGRWYAFSKRARVIIYDPAKVKPEELSTYQDLADPKWKGRILVRSSSNIYNQSLVSAMIETDGAEKTEAWAKGLVANLARKPEGGDTDQIKALVAGLGDIAISNTYYFARILSGDDAELKAKAEKLAIFFPNQQERGTHINISGAGVAAHAPNKANAVKFLEFLISPEAQRIFADANNEFPVRAGVPPAPVVAAWGDFKADPVGVTALGKNNAEAVKLMDRAEWR
ncbi:Fe(3+) ABC transporter substrate-binding protein [Dongia sedimenti]|uniref:Fe(3+) ABC transporter substrate-binding protein n=1 Tax=Dongia sedimenti TaxID=3064282 RepID=A0ABU0YHZ8_9PROT|nr:Fe(3+) ABC transporter substrate-binding protein [Rhodospirillaceae bacterium R-7]